MGALVVAVVGLKGGVGRTTVTANLASALAQAGRRAVAIDLDQQNALAHHFGRGPAAEAGIADLKGEIRALDRRDSRGDAACVPFGQLAPDELAAVEQKLIGDDTWLRRRIQSASPTGCEFVLLDTPAYRSPFLARALELADLVLAVLTPDAGCYATLPAMEWLLREQRGARADGLRAHYVVNQFDAASTPRRDVVTALRTTLGDRVVPTMIHADEAVREAVGRQRTLVREASQSQALADLIELSDWMVAALGAAVETRPLRAAGSRS